MTKKAKEVKAFRDMSPVEKAEAHLEKVTAAYGENHPKTADAQLYLEQVKAA